MNREVHVRICEGVEVRLPPCYSTMDSLLSPFMKISVPTKKITN